MAASFLMRAGGLVVPAASVTTWNPSDQSGLTLSNSDRDIAGVWGSARSTTSKTTEKVHFEIEFIAGTPGVIGIGFANSSQALTGGAAYVGDTLNSLGYYSDTGNILINAASSPTYSTYAVGDVITFEVDFTAELAWIAKNAGNWNNNGSADPATGVGGLSFSSMNAGPWFITASVFDSTARIRTTSAQFTRAISSGFAPWGPSSYTEEADILFSRFSVDPDATRKGHINTLVSSLKTAGVWSKLGAFYTLAAHAEADALLNWVSTSHTLTKDGTLTFTTDRGFAGDGATANRLLLPDISAVTAYTQNSAHIGVWMRAGPGAGTVNAAIRRADGGAGLSIFPRFTDNSTYMRINDDPETSGFAVAGYTGFTLGNRSGATAREGYRDGASVGSYGSSASTAVPAQALWISGGSEDEISVLTIGSSLTAGEVSDFYDALVVYKAAVGW